MTYRTSADIISLIQANSSSAAAGTELKHDFTNKANGAITGNADTGQAWSLSYTPSHTAASPTVASSRYVNADTTGTGNPASYLTAQLTASVSYMETNFDFAGGTTTGGSMCMVAWASALAAPIGTIPDSPCHVVMGPTFYDYGVWSGGAYTVVDTVHFDAFTGSVHVEVFIDKANSTSYVRGPDGVINRFTHALIGSVTATYACTEIFYNNSSTDNRVEIQQFGADSGLWAAQKFGSYRNQMIKTDYLSNIAVGEGARAGLNMVPDPYFQDSLRWADSIGAQSTEQFLSGTQSRKLIATGASTSINLLPQLPNNVYAPTIAGRTYYMEVWLRKKSTNTGGGVIYWQPRTIDNTSTDSVMNTMTITPNTDLSSTAWTRFSQIVTAPTGAMYVKSELFLDSTLPANDSFYLGAAMVTDLTAIANANAATATALANARAITTNLTSTTAATFNGSADITPGVTGTLAVTNGGTGATSVAAARTALGIFPTAVVASTSAAPVIAMNTYGQMNLTPTAACTIGAPTGMVADGQPVVLKITSVSAQTLAWNAYWRAMGVTLPTTTVAGKLTYVAGKYNATDSKIDVLAVGQQP